MSLTLGLFSTFVLVIFGYTMIHLSKKYIIKSIDGNMTDKAYMAFNDVDNIIAEKMSDCDKIMVVANLPYYITTPILTHLIENTEKIDGYVVMMQREVANRLNAKVGTKDYNSLTILLNYYTDVEYLFTVPKKVFVPAPNVESAVVKIMTKEKKEFEVDQKFFKFVRSCFVQRRKTLLNNLISSYGKDKKQDLQASCFDSEIEATRRSE